MAELFDSAKDEGAETLQPDEFYRGLSYLGKPTSLTLPGQEPSAPGGGAAGIGAAAGAPTLAPSVTGTPGAGPSPSGMPTDAISPGIRALLTGASFGSRLANVGANLIGDSAIGAFMSPSGQLTTSAPEILRDLQFPADAGGAAAGDQAGSFLSDLAGGVGGYIGSALPYAPAVADIISAIVNKNPAGVVSPAISGGFQAAQAADLIPAAGFGAGLPIAAAASIIQNIIQDMVQDPGGKKSAVEDYNFITSQAVPPQAQSLQASASVLPLISDRLTTDQAMQLYQLVRSGLKS